MKNEHEENGALRGPLILTQPASNFVAVMSLDWLDETDRAAVSAKTRLGVLPTTFNLKVSLTSDSRLTACAMIRTDMQTGRVPNFHTKENTSECHGVPTR